MALAAAKLKFLNLNLEPMGMRFDQFLERAERTDPAAERLAVNQAGDHDGDEDGCEGREELPPGELEHEQLGDGTHRAGMEWEDVVDPEQHEGDQHYAAPHPHVGPASEQKHQADDHQDAESEVLAGEQEIRKTRCGRLGFLMLFGRGGLFRPAPRQSRSRWPARPDRPSRAG